MITRVSKLKGFDNILGGRDLANLFKDGHVYEIDNTYGEMMITDLGEHALSERHEFSTFQQIMMDGTYLLTKEEKKRQDKQKK